MSKDLPFGPPEVKPGRCNKTIVFGDDYGDNCTTFRCKLKKGHKGLHQEKGDMGYRGERQLYKLEWEEVKKNATKAD